MLAVPEFGMPMESLDALIPKSAGLLKELITLTGFDVKAESNRLSVLVPHDVTYQLPCWSRVIPSQLLSDVARNVLTEESARLIACTGALAPHVTKTQRLCAPS